MDHRRLLIEDPRGTEGNYGSDNRPDLVTDREFTNFEISLEVEGDHRR